MKKIKNALVLCLSFLISLSFCACTNNGILPDNSFFTIQYADDTGVHSITVEVGQLYHIDQIPQKNGYEFMGLYDAQVGGTQYVNAGGSSLSEFSDRKNIVLYPQFKAKEYTLVLDYQGATVTGVRSMKVSYDSEISELPLDLTLENKDFVGWYTKPNRQGIQVSDRYGVIPLKNIVTESIFDLSDPQGGIYIYAGFKNEEFTVTFYLTESGVPVEVKVEYGTPIAEVQPTTMVDGKTVIAWSEKKNDTNKEQVFNGKVTSEMVLYAAEYAYVIDFDSNGGNSVDPIIARAGDAISLPIPTRENYKFVGWQTASGSTFNATKMPTESVKLVAKWQAMIIFDTNGGTEVKSISVPQGSNIKLPTPEKEKCVFAGWYTGDKQKVDLTVMPSESICLKAGWYEIASKSFYLINDKNGLLIAPSLAEMEDDYRDSLGWYFSYYRRLNLSEILNGQTLNLEIKFSATVYSRFTGSNADINIDLFSAPSPGSTYLLHSFSTNVRSQDRKQISWDVKVKTNSDLYVCYYKSGSQTFINNLHVEIIYTDLSEVFL